MRDLLHDVLSRLVPVGPRGWLRHTPGFTATEVCALLRAGAASPRGRAVARCAARPGDWLPPAPDLVRCPAYACERLPRLVYWHARGDPVPALAGRLGLWGSERRADELLALACRAIAARLNQAPADYGYAVAPGERARPG